MHQLHLAVTEFEIRTAYVFTPLVGLYNPDPVLTIRRARRAGHIIYLLFILRGHADRILRMTAHNHRQRARRKAARHLHVARRVRAVLTVIVMPHVGGRDNHIRFFILLQLLDHQLRFVRRFTEFDVGEKFRVANFGRIVSG